MVAACTSTFEPSDPSLDPPPALSPAEKSALRQLVEPLVLRGGPSNSRLHMEVVTYRGVFRHRAGYRGKVKWAGVQVNHPTRKTAFDAAVDVARWYERRLGPQWAELVRNRPKLKPTTRADAPWHVRYSAHYRGFLACVWVEGVRHEVVELRRRKGGGWERTGRLAVFGSAAAAAENLWLWLARVFGPFLSGILWRHPPGKFPAAAG